VAAMQDEVPRHDLDPQVMGRCSGGGKNQQEDEAAHDNTA
jgi:hypothetical protein